MEDPGLRVQPRRGGVVRDLDLGAEPQQLVERALRGAVRVGRSQDSQPLARLAMPPQHIDQRPHAAPTDERHHDVDRIRRRHLGAEFVPDRRLARRVGEDGRIEERRERAHDRLRAPVGETSQQRDQHASRIEKLVGPEIVLSVHE